MQRDRWKVVTTCGEVRGDGRDVGVRAHLKHDVHTDHYVEQEMTMEQPESRVVCPKSQNDVTVVGYGNRIFRRRQVTLLEVTLKQTSPVKVEGMLQVDFFDILVG